MRNATRKREGEIWLFTVGSEDEGRRVECVCPEGFISKPTLSPLYFFLHFPLFLPVSPRFLCASPFHVFIRLYLSCVLLSIPYSVVFSVDVTFHFIRPRFLPAPPSLPPFAASSHLFTVSFPVCVNTPRGKPLKRMCSKEGNNDKFPAARGNCARLPRLLEGRELCGRLYNLHHPGLSPLGNGSTLHVDVLF